MLRNRYGRRPGRGIRPWLLLPKVIAVNIYFGALVAATVLWLTGPRFSAPAENAQQSLLLIAQMHLLFLYLIVPALLGAMLMGILLFLQHPRVFARMRWWQLKIVLLAIGVPCAHLLVSSRLQLVRQAVGQHQGDLLAQQQLSWALLALVAGSLVLIVIGRLKPRLGQNWARVYAKIVAGK